MTRTFFTVAAALCVGIAAPALAQGATAEGPPAQQDKAAPDSPRSDSVAAQSPTPPTADATAAPAALSASIKGPDAASAATSSVEAMRPGNTASANTDAKPEHRFTLGLAQVGYSSFFRGTNDPWVGEAAWAWLARPELLSAEFGAGVRFTARREGVDVPLEAFVRARFEADFGYWRPAAGPELGVSGLARFSPRADRLPGDLDVQEAKRLSPFYASLDAAPLRFRFGRWQVSALEIGVGTSLGPPGATLRTKVTLLSAGYVL